MEKQSVISFHSIFVSSVISEMHGGQGGGGVIPDQITYLHKDSSIYAFKLKLRNNGEGYLVNHSHIL